MSNEIVFCDEEELVLEKLQTDAHPDPYLFLSATYDECGIDSRDTSEMKQQKHRDRMQQPNPPHHEDLVFHSGSIFVAVD